MTAAYVHPRALVETEQIGDGTRVWASAHIMAGATVGEHCNVGDQVFIEGGVTVGSGVVIKNNCLLFDGLTVEDCVFIGPGVTFTNDLFPRSRHLPEAAHRYDDTSWLVATRVGYGAAIGGGAVITPGAHIGRYALIAAGAVVTGPVDDHRLMVGAPARPVGWVCRCGRKLADPPAPTEGPAACGCGLRHVLTPTGPRFEGSDGPHEVSAG